jgi:starch-binding outer membrane protein SusE/F
MKTHLHKLVLFMLMAVGLSAQVTTVGLIGSGTAGGWDNDTDMVRSTADSNVWTLYTTLTTGDVKFRANDAWEINWGSKGFPKGTGTQGGDNIPVFGGEYLISFNSSTGVYDFDVDSDIGILGSATPGGWDNDTDMYIDATDSNSYYLSLDLIVGEAKFRANDAWTVNWGAKDFPMGVGVQGGDNIPVAKAGNYKVSFNKSTGAYKFEQPPAFTKIGIIGSATAGGWDNDTDLTQDPSNADLWRGDMTLKTGDFKFRADDAWTLSWGGPTFPIGTAEVGGANINVTDSARYILWFNTKSLEYNFIKVDPFTSMGIIGSATPGGWDNDTDMVQDSADVNIWRVNINLTNAEAKFRANDAWTINWGGKGFPSDKGTQDGPNIPVVYGNYNVTFNALTGDYRFDILSDIGILGDATSGGWDNDTDMYPDAADSNKYYHTLNLVAGNAKFRANNSWDVNWGAPDFPAGVGLPGGPNIPIAQGGQYYITFDKVTGAYSFTEIVAYTKIGVIGTATAGGWDTDTDLTRDATNGDLWTGRIDLAVGEIKFRADDAWDFSWGGKDFPSGTGVKGGDNIAVPEAGKYLISFNTKTLAYNFIFIKPINAVGIIGDATPGGWDADTDLTRDATNPDLWRVRLELKEGEAKFRANDAWDIEWGAGDFPAGVGEAGGANIPVPAGDYKITFNSLTGAYNFEKVVEFKKISLVGSCGPFLDWPGTDDTRDTYLNKDPNNPNHWTLGTVTLAQYDGTATANGIKFRAEAAWDINWGAETFPGGIGTANGPNIQCNAGNYSIDFKSDTGEYGFADPVATYDILDNATIHIYPNPSVGDIYIDVKAEEIKGETQVTIYDAQGKIVTNLSANTNNIVKIDGSGLQAGQYIVQLKNAKYLVGRNLMIIK